MFALLYDAAACTFGTVLEVDFALALAVGTCNLRLNLHEAHVNVLHCDALPLASRAGLFLPSFGTRSLALGTIDVAVDCEGLAVTHVKFLKRYF